MQYEIEIDGKVRQVVVHRSDGVFLIAVDGREVPVDAVRIDAQTWSLIVEGRSYEVTVTPSAGAGAFSVGVGATPVAVSLNARRRWGRKDEGAGGSGPQRVVAPMPGKIVRVLVKAGDVVQAQQPLIVVEAMKMENELRASANATVSEVHAAEGQSVDAGALLAVLAPAN